MTIIITVPDLFHLQIHWVLEDAEVCDTHVVWWSERVSSSDDPCCLRRMRYG